MGLSNVCQVFSLLVFAEGTARAKSVAPRARTRVTGSGVIGPGSVLQLGFMLHVQAYIPLYTQTFILLQVQVASPFPFGWM